MATQQRQNSDPRFRELLEQMEALKSQSLASAIPKECYEQRTWRGMLGFFVSYALWGGAIWAVSVSHPVFWLPLWLVAGLGGWGLHCIAHDCGHGSFSRSQGFNSIIGHLALFPLLYPFHAWRHVHNLHHANTNSLEKDTDWRPVDAQTYARLPLVPDRLVYWGTRSVFFWLGTAHYWVVSGFKPSFFPQAKARNDVRRSMAFMALAMAIFFPVLIYFTGWVGVLKYFVMPWVAIHAWFSMTTLMHHTSEDLPFLAQKEWSIVGSKLLLTTDFRYPQWLHFLTHNISVHAAHHVSPKVPFYNLPRAQAALKAAFPGMIREKDFTFSELFRIVSRCHLYNPATGYYIPFSERGEDAPMAKTTAS